MEPNLAAEVQERAAAREAREGEGAGGAGVEGRWQGGSSHLALSCWQGDDRQALRGTIGKEPLRSVPSDFPEAVGWVPASAGLSPGPPVSCVS